MIADVTTRQKITVGYFEVYNLMVSIIWCF